MIRASRFTVGVLRQAFREVGYHVTYAQKRKKTELLVILANVEPEWR